MFNIANRKLITRFQTSYRWSAYVTLILQKNDSKNEFVVFMNKIQVQSKKVCYKVSLCENFPLQSRSKTVPLSNGVVIWRRNRFLGTVLKFATRFRNRVPGTV